MASRAAQAQNAATTASNTGANLGATANQVGSTLIPGEERMATNPPGMSPADLANQQTQALQAAGGEAGTARGALMQRAERMRNPAGVNAGIAASTQGASRAATMANQDVLSQNAQLKAKQQQQGYEGLQGIYGTDTKGMLDAMGLVAPDINSATNASESGFEDFANLAKGLGSLGIKA